VFIFGGVASLLMVPLLAFALPHARPHAKAGGNPVAGLFLQRRTRATLALWVVNFMGLMDLYLLASWLPTTLNAQGLSVPVASLITGFLQVAGAVGALSLGPLVDRYGPKPALPVAYLVAALCIAAIGMAGGSVVLNMVAVFGAGFGIVGCQDCNSGVAAKLYPAEMRSTGVGWALGIGRIGSIIGPFVVGVLLSRHVDGRTIFLLSAVPAVLAAAAYVAMGQRPEFYRRDV
jgi:AAHS family 4-hydroxybenzoate transporter-like MFS transporter